VRFLSVHIDLSEEASATVQKHYNDLFSLEDIGTYAGLCALATMDRDVIMEKALGSAEFRALIELVPDIRELITDFCATRYSSCLAYMQRMRPDLILDPYLGRDDHVDRLFHKIRSKALVQYVHPFETVDMDRMAAVFKMDVKSLEAELVPLIESKAISFRIDTQHRSLHRKRVNVRRDTLANALAMGEASFSEAEIMLLRMNLVKHGLSGSKE
jgi:COP9 signalosome complex subunit 1